MRPFLNKAGGLHLKSSLVGVLYKMGCLDLQWVIRGNGKKDERFEQSGQSR